MTDARIPRLEVDLGHNGGKVAFYDRDDAQKFAGREHTFWSSLGVLNVGGAVFDPLQGALNQLYAVARSGEADDKVFWGQLSSTLKELFAATEPRLLHSGSQLAQSLPAIRDDNGTEALRGALGIALRAYGFDQFSRNADALRGAIALEVARAGLSQASVAGAAGELRELAARQREDWDKARAAMEKSRTDWSAEIAGLRKQLADQEAKFQEDHKARLDDVDARANAAITNINATDERYKRHMEMKAPSNYWEDKAEHHRDRASKLRLWVVGATIAGLAAYIAVIWYQFDNLRGLLLSFKDETPALFVIAALIAIGASLPLWFLRILVRFYVSEEHLATDARERKVMAMTYLALRETGSTTDADRAIVLNSLFRSGQDGIVKEAGGPDGSLAALLARLLDGKTP